VGNTGSCSGDGVAKYYQQQEEILEGFTEMDIVTDKGVLPGMSQVWSLYLLLLCTF
jgi:hypothetical protein